MGFLLEPHPRDRSLGKRFIAMLAATLLGYGFGLIGRRHIFSTLMPALSISSVLTVIVDLDRPWQGYIRVSQQPMTDLQKQMENAR